MSRDDEPTTTDREQIARAALLYAPLRRASGVALFSGCTQLLFGAPTLLLGLVGLDAVGLLLGAGLCACGALEVVSARRLRAGDGAVCARLARNQWVVFALVAAYASVQMIGFDAAQLGGLLSPGTAAGLADLERQGHTPLGDLDGLGSLVATVVYAMYSGVILVSLLVQGLLARMYLRRRELAERYATEVPEWIRRMVEGLAV